METDVQVRQPQIGNTDSGFSDKALLPMYANGHVMRCQTCFYGRRSFLLPSAKTPVWTEFCLQEKNDSYGDKPSLVLQWLI